MMPANCYDSLRKIKQEEVMRENPEKANYWQQQIQTLQESGLSRRACCERNQVKLSTLGYWCQKMNPSARSNKTVHESGWIPPQIGEDEPSGIDLRIGRITIAIKPRSLSEN
jgi:hypothetical protein